MSGAKASGGVRYSPLSPKPVRKPMSPRLFTNLLGQAMARQGLDATLAPAIMADLMAITPPPSRVPERFEIHGVELTWPAGREPRVLYPLELAAFNKALARDDKHKIDECDAIVRVARDVYLTLWAKVNRPDYVARLGGRDASRDALSDTLQDALNVTDSVPVAEPGEHAHHWERSPGCTEESCLVPGCLATQQAGNSPVAGLTNQPIGTRAPDPQAPKRKRKKESDARPNEAPVVIEHVTNAESTLSALEIAMNKLAATVAANMEGASA